RPGPRRGEAEPPRRSGAVLCAGPRFQAKLQTGPRLPRPHSKPSAAIVPPRSLALKRERAAIGAACLALVALAASCREAPSREVARPGAASSSPRDPRVGELF